MDIPNPEFPRHSDSTHEACSLRETSPIAISQTPFTCVSQAWHKDSSRLLDFLLLEPVQDSLNIGKSELLQGLIPDLVRNLFSVLLINSSSIPVDHVSGTSDKHHL